MFIRNNKFYYKSFNVVFKYTKYSLDIYTNGALFEFVKPNSLDYKLL